MLENNILYKIYKEGNVPVIRFKNDGFKNFNQDEYFTHEDEDGNSYINEGCKGITGCFCLIGGMQDSFILSGVNDIDSLSIGYVSRDTLIFNPHYINDKLVGYIPAGKMFDEALKEFELWTKDEIKRPTFIFDRNIDDFDWYCTQAIINADDITEVGTFEKEEQLKFLDTITDGYFSIKTGFNFFWDAVKYEKVKEFQKYIDDNKMLNTFFKAYFNCGLNNDDIEYMLNANFKGSFIDEFKSFIQCPNKKCKNRTQFKALINCTPDTFDGEIKNKDKLLDFIRTVETEIYESEGEIYTYDYFHGLDLKIKIEDGKLNFYNKNEPIEITPNMLLKYERSENRLSKIHKAVHDLKNYYDLGNEEPLKSTKIDLIDNLYEMYNKLYGKFEDDKFIFNDDLVHEYGDVDTGIHVEYDTVLNDAIIEVSLNNKITSYNYDNPLHWKKWSTIYHYGHENNNYIHKEELKDLINYLQKIINEGSINKFNPDAEDTKENLECVKYTHDFLQNALKNIEHVYDVCKPFQIRNIIKDSRDFRPEEKDFILNELETKPLGELLFSLATKNEALLHKINTVLGKIEEERNKLNKQKKNLFEEER